VFLILSLAKRGFQATVPLEEIVNAVLYKLKTGVLMASTASKVII
jgi:hypothetical protein